MKRLIYELCVKLIELVKDFRESVYKEDLARAEQLSLLRKEIRDLANYSQRWAQLIQSEITNMKQEITDALARAATTIGDGVTTAVNEATAKELAEVKELINNGGSPAEVVAAIDTFAANTSAAIAAGVKAAIDKISVDAAEPAAENPPSGETGSGSSGGDQ